MARIVNTLMKAVALGKVNLNIFKLKCLDFVVAGTQVMLWLMLEITYKVLRMTNSAVTKICHICF